MTKVHKPITGNPLIQSIVSGIQEVKGHDIMVLDLRSIPHAVADYFVVCHGNSNTQVQSIARSIEAEVQKDLNDRPWNKEGVQNANWILLDYSEAVVHIFYKEDREYYALEDLWADAKISEVESRA